MSYIGILVSFTFVHNIVLDLLMGEKSFLTLASSRKIIFVYGGVLSCGAALSSLTAWALYHGILLPLGVPYLQTLIFILTITGLGIIAGLLLDHLCPAFYAKVRDYLPLAATNCTVLGVSLVSVRRGYTVTESLTAGLCAGAGYFLAAFLLLTLKESMKNEWLPRPFRGVPITLISAGLMALAFMAFDDVLLKNLVTG
ncbi:MAG: electron transport complex subunit RsxA [Spirochaetales bacterium]|jgi:electron transport complex protein RnfA|nr:electron transport complex subunit RsxA [Spirochaetales bacterium]